MARRIVFHCRFGAKLGWGHVIRSSALAEAAQDLGWRTVLRTSSDVSILGMETCAAFDEVIRARDGGLDKVVENADALFVDEMYWKDGDYEKIARVTREYQCCLAASDDMRQRRLGCVDLVVNPEPGLSGRPYETAGPQLVGEGYCLLRRGFRENSETFKTGFSDESIPVFVMLGGSDAFGLSETVLRLLRQAGGGRIAPVLVSGELGEAEAKIKDALSGFSEYRWLKQLDSRALANWMRACRFAIVGCGSSVFELAAVRTPFVGLSLVDNQRRSAAAIARNWGVRIVDFESSSGFEGELMNAVEDALGREREQCFENVDTEGAFRVMAEVEKISDMKKSGFGGGS